MFEDLVKNNDFNILHKKFGISVKEIELLGKIRGKLMNRRLKI